MNVCIDQGEWYKGRFWETLAHVSMMHTQKPFVPYEDDAPDCFNRVDWTRVHNYDSRTHPKNRRVIVVRGVASNCRPALFPPVPAGLCEEPSGVWHVDFWHAEREWAF